MKNIDNVRNAKPFIFDEEHPSDRAAGARFTPGEFLKETGTVIAACLGLGLLAQVFLG